jgi:hypothetical protein
MTVRIIPMRLTKLLGSLVLAAASSVLASAATAQTAPSVSEPIRLETIPEAFVRSFFKDSGDFYHNRSIPRQIQYILGPGIPGRASFPELEIERDAERITKLYRDLIEQQGTSDPFLRTPDLPNPFNTTLRQLPITPGRFGGRVEGTEFILEPPPLR